MEVVGPSLRPEREAEEELRVAVLHGGALEAEAHLIAGSTFQHEVPALTAKASGAGRLGHEVPDHCIDRSDHRSPPAVQRHEVGSGSNRTAAPQPRPSGTPE